jgi:hypothetical protein
MRAVVFFGVVAAIALLGLAAAAGVQAQEHVGVDLSMLDIYNTMPVDLSSPDPNSPEAQAVEKLHQAAGEEADTAIREAELESFHTETVLAETAANAAAHSSKWDDSVPEVHLRSEIRGEEDRLLSEMNELEVVDHLEHAKPELTAPSAMLSKIPVLGQKPAQEHNPHSFVEHAVQAAATTEAEGEIEAEVVTTLDAGVDVEADADADADADSEQSVDAEADADLEAEAESHSETEAEGEIHAEIATDADTESEVESTVDHSIDVELDTESDSVSDSESGVLSLTDLQDLLQMQGMSESQVENFMEHLGEQVADAEAAQETEAETETDSESEAETEAEDTAAVETEAEEKTEEATEEQQPKPEAEEKAEGSAEDTAAVETESQTEEQSQTESESESESSAETESESAEDSVHLTEHDAPAVTELATEVEPAQVTPLHSAAFQRAHPTLKKIRRSVAPAAAGYALPSFIQVQSQARAVAQEVDTTKFNPSSVQLGPSKDAYGYVPMTGAEFLNSPPQPVSLAQMNMQYQPQQAEWLPPPVAAEATPLYEVGMGGLRPNYNAGPYQGQYGIAAGGREMQQEPAAFIQY